MWFWQFFHPGCHFLCKTTIECSMTWHLPSVITLFQFTYPSFNDMCLRHWYVKNVYLKQPFLSSPSKPTEVVSLNWRPKARTLKERSEETIVSVKERAFSLVPPFHWQCSNTRLGGYFLELLWRYAFAEATNSSSFFFYATFSWILWPLCFSKMLPADAWTWREVKGIFK